MGTVIAIPPKQDSLLHRRTNYTLTYIPATRQWQWSFTLSMVVTLDGIRDTYEEAMRDARHHIDMSQGVA